VLQNAPAPRFSRSAPVAPRAPANLGSDLHAVLADWGIEASAAK